MYTPPHFKETRREALHALIEAHPLGVLVTAGAGGLDADHLPFHLDPDSGAHGALHAHVARANPVWQSVANGDEVLVVFRGEEAYIPPGTYPSKHETRRQVPTWNYRVVHVHGRIAVRDDERFVRSVVARLTRRHETGQATPWKMGDAPADYLDTMLRAIVGIEIDITRLDGKFKLSQNREARDRTGAAEALIARGEPVLGRAMLDTLDRD